MTRGLILCVLCGLGASLVNFGLAYGGPIIAGAQRAGAAQLWANNAVWLPVMVAGSIPNLAYCLYLMRKNATGGRYSEAGTASYWGLAFVMAALWFASTAIYGISTNKLGSLGAVLGWPLFMSLIVITASVLGIMTGEWKGAGGKPLRIQMAGVMFLVLAVFVLSAASRWV
jgi:L-rhamnose-H+ transport protein